MRAPGNFADCVVMSRENHQRALSWGTNIKGTDEAINSGGSNDRRTILIPVVGQGFGRRTLLRQAMLGRVEGDGQR